MLKLRAIVYRDYNGKEIPVTLGNIEIEPISCKDDPMHMEPFTDLGCYKIKSWTCDGRHSYSNKADHNFEIHNYNRKQGFWFLARRVIDELCYKMPPTTFFDEVEENKNAK